MTEKVITLNSNMDARAAANFVQAASKFDSAVYVKIGDKKINAKSIMGMMTIGVLSGQRVTLVAEGSDEKTAIAELSKFFPTT